MASVHCASPERAASSVVGINRAADLLAVSVESLRRWDASGKLESAVYRTMGNHRRFDLAKLKALLGMNPDISKAEEISKGKTTILYSRVSTPKQKVSLEGQKERLESFCKVKYPGEAFEHISSCCSGVNFDNEKLHRLFDRVINGEVKRVIVPTSSRLLRFGAKLVERIFKQFQVEVIYSEPDRESEDNATLADDLLSIITHFTNKNSGLRFAKLHGFKPTEAQLDFINKAFTDGLHVRKTLILLTEASLLTNDTGKAVPESFLRNYWRKHYRVLRKIASIPDSSANPTGTGDVLLDFTATLDRENGKKTRFRAIYEAYTAYAAAAGAMALPRNKFSQRLRQQGYRTCLWNGNLYLRGSFKGAAD